MTKEQRQTKTARGKSPAETKRKLTRAEKKQIEEAIRRAKGDGKPHTAQQSMRYTNFRGLAQVTNWVRLKFAAMNLKKFAVRKWKLAAENENSAYFFFICLWRINFPIFFQKFAPDFLKSGVFIQAEAA